LYGHAGRGRARPQIAYNKEMSMTENQRFVAAALAMIAGTALFVTFATVLRDRDSSDRLPIARSSVHSSETTSTNSTRFWIVNDEDLSFADTSRRQFRIQVDGVKTESEILAICKEILGARRDLHEANAVSFFFYLPGTDTDRLFTAGQATWAPDGCWEHARQVATGDTSRHKLVVQVGNAIGNRLVIDEAPLPESKRRNIFWELVAAQDAGIGDSEAYTVVSQRHGLPEQQLFQIAGEGAAKGWPMP
jgi:hypothetical protein